MIKIILFTIFLFTLSNTYASDRKEDIAIDILSRNIDIDKMMEQSQVKINKVTLKLREETRKAINLLQKDATSDEIAELEGTYLNFKNAKLYKDGNVENIVSTFANKYTQNFTYDELLELQIILNSDLHKKLEKFEFSLSAWMSNEIDRHNKELTKEYDIQTKRFNKIAKSIMQRKYNRENKP